MSACAYHYEFGKCDDAETDDDCRSCRGRRPWFAWPRKKPAKESSCPYRGRRWECDTTWFVAPFSVRRDVCFDSTGYVVRYRLVCERGAGWL